MAAVSYGRGSARPGNYRDPQGEDAAAGLMASLGTPFRTAGTRMRDFAAANPKLMGGLRIGGYTLAGLPVALGALSQLGQENMVSDVTAAGGTLVGGLGGGAMGAAIGGAVGAPLGLSPVTAPLGFAIGSTLAGPVGDAGRRLGNFISGNDAIEASPEVKQAIADATALALAEGKVKNQLLDDQLPFRKAEIEQQLALRLKELEMNNASEARRMFNQSMLGQINASANPALEAYALMQQTL